MKQAPAPWSTGIPAKLKSWNNMNVFKQNNLYHTDLSTKRMDVRLYKGSN